MITLRFGIIDGQPKTHGQIARLRGITPERVRRIESKTMSKLRHPSRSEVLAVRDDYGSWVGFIDALFGRHEPSNDDLVLCPQCVKRWFNPRSGVAGGRVRKYCSDVCRQAAYRARRKDRSGQ